MFAPWSLKLRQNTLSNTCKYNFLLLFLNAVSVKVQTLSNFVSNFAVRMTDRADTDLDRVYTSAMALLSQYLR